MTPKKDRKSGEVNRSAVYSLSKVEVGRFKIKKRKRETETKKNETIDLT